MKKCMSQTSITWCLLLFVFIWLNPSCLAAVYKVIDLGCYKNDTVSIARRINDRGQIVVRSFSYASSPKFPKVASFHTFVWDRVRKYSLGSVLDLGLNNAGQIVYDNDNHLFIWQHGRSKKLPLHPSAMQDEGKNLINDKGQVAGQMLSGTKLVSVWQNGRIVSLPVNNKLLKQNHLLINSVIVEAINNKGQLLLTCYKKHKGYGVDNRAYLWSQGRLIDIGIVHGNRNIEANWLNDRGSIVGTANQPPASGPGFLFRQGHIQVLPALTQLSQTVGLCTNNRGQIVGSTGDGAKEQAMLWQKGKVFNLNSLIGVKSGWRLEEATAINNHGEIVGIGIRNGKERAFLLYPKKQDG